MSFPLIFFAQSQVLLCDNSRLFLHVFMSCLPKKRLCFSWQRILLSIQIFFIGIPGIRHRGVSGKRQLFPQGTQSLEEFMVPLQEPCNPVNSQSPHRYHRNKGKSIADICLLQVNSFNMSTFLFIYLSLPRFVS